MKLHNLHPHPGATKQAKRVGRGPGSGRGKTAGKGHKGLLARSGRANQVGFEGGQMPLVRRLPKRGFYSKFRTEFAVVNLKALSSVPANTEVSPKLLVELGLVKRARRPVKILGEGDLDRPLVVHAHKFSQSALQKIQQAGGQAKVIGRV